MSAELMDALLRLVLAFTAALVVVLALRLPWRRAFGARAAMLLWALVPLGLTTALLPAPVEWMAATSSAPLVAIATSMPASQSVPTVESTLSISEILAALWLSGALLCAYALWRQQRRFLLGLGRLRHWRGNTYFSSNAAHGPALLGPWRPRIVLPSDFLTRYTAEQQTLILAHEYAHLRRRDLWVTLLACAARVAFWFHPLAHLGSRCLRLDQELACDEAVIEHSPRARRDYATAILNTQLTDLGLPVGCFWQSSQPVKTRIVMISNSVPQPLPRRLGYALGLALAALGLPLAWASQPAQVRVVNIDSPPPATSSVLAPAVSRFAPAGPTRHASARSPIDPSQLQRREFAVVAPVLSLDAALASNDSRLELTLAMAQQSSDPALLDAEANDFVPPKLVKALLPKWPSSRRTNAATSQGGEVVVGATVDAEGIPTDLKIVKSSHRLFERLALSAVKRYRFEPARRAGSAVSAYVEVPLVWKLDEQPVYEEYRMVGPPKVRYPPPEARNR